VLTLFFFLFLCLIPSGNIHAEQQLHGSKEDRSALARIIHYPMLLHADIPLYPPVPWSVRFGGMVEIQAVVEDGIIKHTQLKRAMIEPQLDTKKFTKASEDKLLPYLVTPSLENLKTWKFAPEEKGSFVVTFVYKLEGEETLMPENAKVELDLPLMVKVTAKPFRPTHSP
jgi:hypothetical protein